MRLYSGQLFGRLGQRKQTTHFGYGHLTRDFQIRALRCKAVHSTHHTNVNTNVNTDTTTQSICTPTNPPTTTASPTLPSQTQTQKHPPVPSSSGCLLYTHPRSPSPSSPSQRTLIKQTKPKYAPGRMILISLPAVLAAIIYPQDVRS